MMYFFLFCDSVDLCFTPQTENYTYASPKLMTVSKIHECEMNPCVRGYS